MPAHRRRQREPSPGPSWNTLSGATQQSTSKQTHATSDFSEAEIDELAPSQTPNSPRNSSKVTKNNIKPTAKIDFPTQKHTVRVSKLNVSKDASSVSYKGAGKRTFDINSICRKSISSASKSHRTGQNRKIDEKQGDKGRRGLHGRKTLRPFRSISRSPSLPPPEDIFSQRGDFGPKAITSIVSCPSGSLDMIELFSSDEEQPATISLTNRTKVLKRRGHTDASTSKSSTKPTSTPRTVQSLGTIEITSSDEDTNPSLTRREISSKIDLTMTSESDGENTITKKRTYSRRKDHAAPVMKSASPDPASSRRTPLFLPDDDVLPEAGKSLKALESSTAGCKSDDLNETDVEDLRGFLDRSSSNYGYGGNQLQQSPLLVEETTSQSTPETTPYRHDKNIYRHSSNIFRRSCALFGHTYTPSLSPRPSTVDPRLVSASGSLETRMEVDAFLASCTAGFLKD